MNNILKRLHQNKNIYSLALLDQASSTTIARSLIMVRFCHFVSDKLLSMDSEQAVIFYLSMYVYRTHFQ